MILNMILAETLDTALNNFFGNALGILQAVGVGGLILGIAAGGLLRMFAFGNERRIAMSNVALSCAVVGFIILMLSGAAGNWFETNVPQTTN
jgi:hypothetical protein